MLLTVFLPAGVQPEIQQLRQDFLAHIEALGDTSLEFVEITVLHEKEIKAMSSGKDVDAEATVKALESFISSKRSKSPKKEKKEKEKKKKLSLDLTTPLHVVILTAFPNTVDHFRAIVETSSQFPVLDAVIQLAMKAPGVALVNSEDGPDTTLKQDFEKLKVEASGSIGESVSIAKHAKGSLVADMNIADFLLSSRDFHGGNITLDEINGFRMADEAEDEENYALVPRDMVDIYADFIHLCRNLGNLKDSFYHWCQGVKTVNVKFDPKVVKRASAAMSSTITDQPTGVWKVEPLYNTYQGFVNLLPSDCQSPGGVLFSMVQSIVHTTDRDSKTDVFNCVDFTTYDFNNALLPADTDHQTFSRTGSSSSLLEGVIRHSRLDEESTRAGNLLVIEEGDSNAHRAIRASRYLSVAGDPSKSIVNATTSVTDLNLLSLDEGALSLPTQNACAGLIQFENEAIYRAQVPRLLGQGGLPIVPTITAVERNIQESELLTFSSFSPPDIHRFNMLRIFDEMLQNSIPRIANFTGQHIGGSIEDVSITKRKFFRHIPGFALPQILARDLDTEPAIIREYYPLTDQLLLGVLWIPPNRRMGLKEWSPSRSLHTKPTYDQYMVMAERQNFTPRTAGGLRTSVNVSKGHMDKYHQDTCIITPSDKSMVTAKCLSSTSESWMSVHLDNTMFGLRMTPKFNTSGGGLSSSSSGGGAAGGGAGGKASRVKRMSSQQEANLVTETGSKGGKSKRSSSQMDPPGSAGKDGGSVGSSREGGLKRIPSQAEISNEGDLHSDMSMSALSQTGGAGKGHFVCHTDDNVRISASILSKAGQIHKPDRKCFVCVNMTFSNGMVSYFNSDGVVSFMAPPSLQTPQSTEIEANAEVRRPYGEETNRHCLNGGVVTRHLDRNYLYTRDVLMPDGTRILTRGGDLPPPATSHVKKKHTATSKNSPKKKVATKKGKTLNKQSTLAYEEHVVEPKEKICPDPYLLQLFQSAPHDWRYVRLEASGEVIFYNGEPGSEEGSAENTRVELPSGPLNIRTSYIDAESRSEVFEYNDGRIMILWAEDCLREVRFPDGTRTVTHLKTNAVFVEKANLPSIEYDVDVDRVSKRHSLGLQVPIAKGGERTRCRVALPDGTAVFIKYNTKITAKYNGSIKIVRRNHEVVLAEDGGVVTYFPASAWGSVSDKEFRTDSFDEAVSRVEEFKTREENVHTASPARTGHKKKIRFQGDGSRTGNKSPDAQSRGSTAMTALTTDSHHHRSTERKSVRNHDEGSLSSLNKIKKNEFLSDLASGSGGASVVSSSSIGSIDSLIKQQVAHNSTTYTFNLIFMSCTIKDHENNIFDLELARPMEPFLQLAGEIEDMKPKAISESTTEPRLFIINRDGNATEVVRNETLEALENSLDTTPGLTREVTDAEHLSCDLGNTRSHAYFRHQQGSSAPGGGGGVPFQEVFGRRYWHAYTPPTRAAILINQMENKKYQPTKFVDSPNIFESQVMTEYAPLSQEGYVTLANDLSNWQNWRAKRVQMMDRYSFIDPRTPADLEAEKEMSSKVKKAYKAARQKAIALKKKEKEKLLQSQKANMMSCVEEDLDEEPFSSDEEDTFVDDPETLEVVEAFTNYSVEYDTLGGSELKIPLEDCRPALVQILNRFVSKDDIAKSLNDGSTSALTLEQFRQLYFIIKDGTAAQLSLGSHHDELRRATITTSVPLLNTSMSLKSILSDRFEQTTEFVGDRSAAAGSAVQAARLSKTCAQ